MKNGPYEFVVPPPEYPGRRYRGKYAYEHSVVWWQKTGELAPAGFVVHHKNHNKRDNHPDNLELKSVGEHSREHSTGRGLTGQMLPCGVCGADIYVRKNRIESGRKVFFCCVEHGWEGRVPARMGGRPRKRAALAQQ